MTPIKIVQEVMWSQKEHILNGDVTIDVDHGRYLIRVLESFISNLIIHDE